MVAADCRTVDQTLSALNEALGTISQSTGVSQQWGGFGLIGLPIMGAIKAVKGVAGQYVRQQTGTPLATWTELVANSTAQVEAYLSGLGNGGRARAALLGVGRDGRRREAGGRGRGDPAGDPLADAGVEAGPRSGRAARSAGGRDPGGRHRRGAGAVGARPSRPSCPGSPSSVQRRIKEVQSRTTERSGDLRQWVLQPFVDLHDRVRQLPSLTEQLAREVALLEILLELEIAELRVCQGEIPPAQAKVVRLRVAASALLPELAGRLADTRRKAADYGTYLDRLERAHGAGEVAEPAYARAGRGVPAGAGRDPGATGRAGSRGGPLAP